MKTSRDATIKKIMDLLAMTEDNGCTEAEAVAAAALAQKLMLKHRIEMADVEISGAEPDEEIRGWEDPLDDGQKSIVTWKGRLALIVARANGCEVYWAYTSSGKMGLMLIGRASDVGTVRYLYGFIQREMNRLGRSYSGNGRTWMNNWRLGVCDAIRDSFREAKEAARREAVEDKRKAEGLTVENALVLINNAMAKVDQRYASVKRYAQEQMNMRYTKGRRTYARHNSSAREAGRRDGRTIDVSRRGPAGHLNG
jgi:hypothetical protein